MDHPAPRLLKTREQLLHLLTEAAEFEHNLLCCYLYAAFSLKEAGAGLSADEAGAVERWRKGIMSVAMEEMVHLALVSNLTVAIGARPHFDRPNFPVAPGFHPAGIVVALAPFDIATLDHFIYLERPGGSNLADGAGFEPQVHYQRGHRPGAALMPAASDYDTIAEFYAGLGETFTDLAAQVGERNLFIGPVGMQVGPDAADLPGLTAITGLESALKAIDTIVVQGEGAAADAEDSHFSRFVSVKQEYEAMLEANPAFAPAYPVARNPVMRPPVTPDDRVHVDAPDTAAVLDLSNAVYNQMLRLLAQAYARSDRGGEGKRRLVDGAMTLMGIFSSLGRLLASLPASASHPGVHGGVSFTTLRAAAPLCETESEWRTIGERIAELATGARGVALRTAGAKGIAERLDRIAAKFT